MLAALLHASKKPLPTHRSESQGHRRQTCYICADDYLLAQLPVNGNGIPKELDALERIGFTLPTIQMLCCCTWDELGMGGGLNQKTLCSPTQQQVNLGGFGRFDPTPACVVWLRPVT